MIALVDYGAGNVRSVQKALRHVGADVQLVSKPKELGQARAIVLPGVGAFDDCLNAMRKQDLMAQITQLAGQGVPFLGICVGYQALFEKSEEFNSCAGGLGIFKGRVVRFSPQHGLKVPQIGWNKLNIVKPDCPLYRNIPDGSYVYFVHSFFPQPEDPTLAATLTTYGEIFASSIWRDNVFATQFHPEKSQKVGLQILSNFLEFAKKG